MTPERRIFIGDQKVEEYAWSGRMVVCDVNHVLFDGTYEEAEIRAAQKFHDDFADLADLTDLDGSHQREFALKDMLPVPPPEPAS